MGGAAERPQICGPRTQLIRWESNSGITSDHAKGETVQDCLADIRHCRRTTVDFFRINRPVLRGLPATSVDRILIKLSNDTVGLSDLDYPLRGILSRSARTKAAFMG